MEEAIHDVRENGSPHTLEQIDQAVATAIERSGDSAAIASLDEKVKECGRLIVRMGTELMEETKRRQALEAEVHLAAQASKAKRNRAEQHSRPIPLTH